jgi:hypothetical protein
MSKPFHVLEQKRIISKNLGDIGHHHRKKSGVNGKKGTPVNRGD